MIDPPSIPGLALSFIGGGAVSITWSMVMSAAPKSVWWGPVIHHGPSNRREIALTFDDGPDGDSTPRILDVLGEHGASAVFFVIGQNAQRFPHVIKRIADEGHLIGNHTWDHDHHGYLRGDAYWESQIDRTNELVAQITGTLPTLFRPPMGIRTGYTMHAAARAGMSVITWSRRGLDGVATTARAIENRIGPTARAGEIVILHDGVEPNIRRSPDATVAAIGPILRQWQLRDLHPVRLDRWLDRSVGVPDTPATTETVSR
ncbi:MAG: polysaccharide deacetylase family protein [Phycisphaerae bacterium]|nr:polysaccharide deacetylase family protein [Phycisphaerae bacterium]